MKPITSRPTIILSLCPQPSPAFLGIGENYFTWDSTAKRWSSNSRSYPFIDFSTWEMLNYFSGNSTCTPKAKYFLHGSYEKDKIRRIPLQEEMDPTPFLLTFNALVDSTNHIFFMLLFGFFYLGCLPPFLILEFMETFYLLSNWRHFGYGLILLMFDMLGYLEGKE